MKILTTILVFFGLWCAQADQIVHGNTSINMDFVKIGSPDNAAYAHRYGSVGYEYRIGTHEVTVDQWNTVRRADPRIGVRGKAPFWKTPQQPAGRMFWAEAAMYCNWLTSGNAYEGVYQFDSAGNLSAIDRSAALVKYSKAYALPTENEWVKAAYFSAGEYSKYSNGTRVVPGNTEANYGKEREAPWKVGSGTVNQNGTYDMGGNLAEWTESAFDGSDSLTADRVVRDGSFLFTSKAMNIDTRDACAMDYSTSHYGFRVVELVK